MSRPSVKRRPCTTMRRSGRTPEAWARRSIPWGYSSQRRFAEQEKCLRECIKLLQDSAANGSLKMYEERAHILKRRKRYVDVLEMINKAIESTSVVHKIQVKGEKLDILIRLCEADSAALLFREIIADLDARNNREFTTQLDDIRTRYEVEKHIAEKQRNRNYFLFALGGCLLLLILLGT
ncbi:MAG: hypothetical protein LBK96_03860, partial [Prevotellaceae bacterium]|nr:hypothetical protein [Prevotellaceae bacterium]